MKLQSILFSLLMGMTVSASLIATAAQAMCKKNMPDGEVLYVDGTCKQMVEGEKLAALCELELDSIKNNKKKLDKTDGLAVRAFNARVQNYNDACTVQGVIREGLRTYP